MENWVNKVTYGNLNFEQLEKLKQKCIADEVIPVLDKKYGKQLDFPLNNSESTIQELNEMVAQVTSMEDSENIEHYARFKRYDRSLAQSILSSFQTKGMDVEELVGNVFDDVTPAILKLKQKYQRPRPYQLAQYYKLKLFPYATTSGHSPSYPSGHTIQTYVAMKIIGNKHPESYGFCEKFIQDVANSRVYLGLHFPSDNDASFIIGQEILQLKSIIDKYKI